jgi:hypothetical protein
MLGIGIDSLPDFIKYSNLLTGNELGKMGALEFIPKIEKENIDQIISELQIDMLDLEIETKVFHLAKLLLSENKVDKALQLLLISKFNNV